jgi:alpha-L-fucosidase
MQHTPHPVSRRHVLAALAATPAVALLPAVAAHAAATTTPLPIPPLRIPRVDLGLGQQPDEKVQWLQDSKLGMFTHWGVYSGPAKGEWYMQNAAITPDTYRHFLTDASSQQFVADAFHAADWAQLAKDLGAKFAVLTTRHHEGFALWPTGHPNAWHSGQAPLHHDFVADYVAAVRAAGLRVGLYYSPINWRYPGYFDVTGTNCAANPWGYTTDPAHKENARILKNEVYQSVRELVTSYGHLDAIWWDGGWVAEQGTDADGAFFWEPGMYRDPNNSWPVDTAYSENEPATGRPLGLSGLARTHQPDIIATPRSGWIGDYTLEEGSSVPTGSIRTGAFAEKTFTVDGSWGYNAAATVMSYGTAMAIIANSFVRNVTVLINVGPDRHGVVPTAQADLLRRIGTFMAANADAIYSTRGGPWNPVTNQAGFTYRDNTIYVHLLPGLAGTSYTTPPVGDATVIGVHDVVSRAALSHTVTADGRVTITGIDRTRFPDDTVVAVVLDRTVQPADIAAGKATTADSTETSKNNLATHATDGSTATRWCAADGSTGHWLRVDLGATTGLTGARIAWEFPSTRYLYRIDGSVDGNTWNVLADLTTTTSTDQVQTAAFTGQYRYVRVAVTGLPAGVWASIRKFELYNRPFTTDLSIPA